MSVPGSIRLNILTNRDLEFEMTDDLGGFQHLTGTYSFFNDTVTISLENEDLRFGYIENYLHHRVKNDNILLIPDKLINEFDNNYSEYEWIGQFNYKNVGRRAFLKVE
jgi:hypothetical protein